MKEKSKIGFFIFAIKTIGALALELLKILGLIILAIIMFPIWFPLAVWCAYYEEDEDEY